MCDGKPYLLSLGLGSPLPCAVFSAFLESLHLDIGFETLAPIDEGSDRTNAETSEKFAAAEHHRRCDGRRRSARARPRGRFLP